VRAVGFTGYGGPEVLGLVELPDPEPGPAEIRIRVAAASVNPSDTLFRSGGLGSLITGEPPFVGGLELAGTVDAAGEGARFRPGDRVAAMTKFIPDGRGAHADLVVVHGDQAAAVPDGLGLAEAATVPMNGLTVRLALDTLDLPAGEWVAVTGAAGAVGGYATQLAAVEGLRIVAIASSGDEDLARTLGAESFVPRGPDSGRGVRDVVPDGVAAVVDAANVGAPVLPAIRDGGRVIALRAFAGEPERGIQVDQISVRGYLREPEKLAALLALAGAGRLTPRIAATFAPAGAAEAHRLLDAGGVRGRLVLDFEAP
jgi:NADPH:quinone reductase